MGQSNRKGTIIMDDYQEILHMRVEDVEQEHVNSHPAFEFYRREFITKHGGSRVALYEVPPGKSAFPYHTHSKNEENYYILSGEATLKTPAGERIVKAGEFLHFPTGDAGAHKITNTSESEMFVYLDFDATDALDVCKYPDSGKIGIWGAGINRLFKLEDAVEYYEGE